MALDATVAGASADSYLTVAAADALAAGDLVGDPEVAKWLDPATTLAMKEQALRQASNHVNAQVSTGWLPYAPAAQASSGMVFPRSIDVTGSTPFIPKGIKLAVYQQARYLLRNARTIAQARVRQAQALESASEPDVSWSRSGDDSGELSSAALIHLAPFVRVQGGRGLRSVRLASRMPGADS